MKPPPTSAASAKAEIRTRIIAARNCLPALARQQYGRTILEKVVALEAFRRANVVMGYSSFGSELDTALFIEAVLTAGKRLVLPRIVRGSQHLETYVVQHPEADLMPGVWGIREPNPGRCAAIAPGDLEFILVPGVAFDRRGGRIGYGKGFYDNLLAACQEHGRRPWAMAATFDVQLVETIPMEPHDVSMHAIITERQSVFLRD